MFVVHFMCPSHGFGIAIIGISEPFKSLVDKDVVNQKISETVDKNPNAYGESRPKIVLPPKNYAGGTDDGVENEEQIIAFKPWFVIFLVVIFVKTPKKSMHYIFVRKPSHKFHAQKSDA